MAYIDQFILKGLRKLHSAAFGNYVMPYSFPEYDADAASDKISALLSSDEPCMIARFGANELKTVVNYLGILKGKTGYLKYIRGEALDWWWSGRLKFYMKNNAGFFPVTSRNLERFSQLMILCTSDLDLLGSWRREEAYLLDFMVEVPRVCLSDLDPYWSSRPWTKTLEGKKVLVVHPFAKLIEQQYGRREKLFADPNVLPQFELKTIQAVQSIGGRNKDFGNWFDALESMERQIDEVDFDVALIGCGAYGFPLASYVKKTGRKAVHLGGSLQLLFGIRGRRWDDKVDKAGHDFRKLYNGYWVRPNDSLRPEAADKVENGAYW